MLEVEVESSNKVFEAVSGLAHAYDEYMDYEIHRQFELADYVYSTLVIPARRNADCVLGGDAVYYLTQALDTELRHVPLEVAIREIHDSFSEREGPEFTKVTAALFSMISKGDFQHGDH